LIKEDGYSKTTGWNYSYDLSIFIEFSKNFPSFLIQDYKFKMANNIIKDFIQILKNY
jgi:hypothetical protein